MIDRLFGALLMGSNLFWGTWKTFKALKKGAVDADLLKLWTCLSLFRIFEEFTEPILRYLPFYSLGKCFLLGEMASLLSDVPREAHKTGPMDYCTALFTLLTN